MVPNHAEYQAFLRPACEPAAGSAVGRRLRDDQRADLLGTLKSAQRELNPHFRHGKATGCRRPPLRGGARMGASWCAELSMNKSTGRDLNPRRRITGAVSLPLDDQCISISGTGGYRTHIVRFKRPVHYPVCHSPIE